ncbi:MAG: hypothetical protein JST40_08570 [Armatimonadetes bacterium]|nr:hypothetical protein [Armatimonadota bacterium]
MRLCRFVVMEEPDQVRSGIFHENRVYETDGERAIGIHDLTKVGFLPPIGQPPNIRLFHPDGSYRYAGTAGLMGPGSEYEVPASAQHLTLRPFVAVAIKDEGDQISLDEANDFLLAFLPMLELKAESAWDFPLATGPFLHTVDEFEGLPSGQCEVLVNELHLGTIAVEFPVLPTAALERCTRTQKVVPGDLLGLPLRSEINLLTSPLGRNLQPGDQILIRFEQFGAITLRLS